MCNLSEIIETIKYCCKEISTVIKDHNSLELEQLSNEYNLSGDNAKKLDLVANNILKNNLAKSKYIRVIGSEEEDTLIKTSFTNADYMICFDPLDGSSNIGVNITTGTIFALYKYNNDQLINGNNIVMAGYCLYGGATQLILATNQINIYQLNNTFKLIYSNWKIPLNGKIYSLNESNKHHWTDSRYHKYINKLITKGYTSRWVGSLIADAHRTLIKGGFFSYPANKKNINGKIRLLYEAYPFAYIFKIAGGYSLNGKENKCLLDVDYPEKNCHQKTPIILASKQEIDLFMVN